MEPHIPIHNADYYTAVIVLLVDACPIVLANRLYVLLGCEGKVPLTTIYGGLLVVILATNVFVFGLPPLMELTLITSVNVLLIGMLGGLCAIIVDYALVHWIRRGHERKRIYHLRVWQMFARQIGKMHGQIISPIRERARQPKMYLPLAKAGMTLAVQMNTVFYLPSLLILAALEELLYRYYFSGLVWGITGSLVTAIIISGIAYGLPHGAFGLENVFSKMILGLLFTGVILVSNSVLAAMISHATFNLAAYIAIRHLHLS